MKPALFLLVALFFLVYTSGSRAEDDQITSVTLLDNQGFIARCKVRKKVSLVEPDWLSLEFENQTDKPLHIKDADCDISFECTSLRSKRKIATGGLCRGQFKELLADVLDPVRGIGGILPPRTKRTQAAHLTESASATGLKFLTPAGDHVVASVLLMVEFSDGRKLNSLADGGKLEFEWIPWGANEIAEARKRLRRLLENPKDSHAHHLLVVELINNDGVSNDLSATEVVKAIPRQLYETSGSSYLNDFAKRKFPNDPAWLKYNNDLARARKVVENHDLWDKTCVEPVVLQYESRNYPYYQSLELLHKHRRDWIADKEITKRLSQASHRRIFILGKKLEFMSNDEKNSWTWGIKELAKCGELSDIPLMRAGLDDKLVIHDIRHFADLSFGNPPPALRVCDETLRALLTLLGDDIESAYRQAGYTSTMNDRGPQQVEGRLNRVHDKMIADLKLRLAQLAK